MKNSTKLGIGALASGLVQGYGMAAQIGRIERLNKRDEMKEKREREREKLYKDLADLAEGYTGAWKPKTYQPTGVVGAAAAQGVSADFDFGSFDPGADFGQGGGAIGGLE